MCACIISVCLSGLFVWSVWSVCLVCPVCLSGLFVGPFVCLSRIRRQSFLTCSQGPVFVFWDIENVPVPVPSGAAPLTGARIVSRIERCAWRPLAWRPFALRRVLMLTGRDGAPARCKR